MWTHLQPYLEDDGTAGSIARKARVALWRAIADERVIALTGSGISAAHGMPNWTGLVYYYHAATRRQYTAAMKIDPGSGRRKPPSRQIRRLINQVNLLCRKKDKLDGQADDFYKLKYREAEKVTERVLLMDMCEEILRRLPDADDGTPRLFLARQEVAQFFRKGAVGLVLDQLARVYDQVDTADPKRSGDTPWQLPKPTEFSGEPPLRADRTAPDHMLNIFDNFFELRLGDPEAEYVQLDFFLVEPPADPMYRRFKSIINNFFTTKYIFDSGNTMNVTDIELPADEYPRPGRFESSKAGDDTVHDLTRDPVHALLRDLKITRVLTLNYDIQAERWIAASLRTKNDPLSSDFQDLCRPVPKLRGDRRRRIIETGARRGALSATMARDNVGELINFASFPNAYDYQVFHLHGRVDDPANMVVTEDDYRQVYLQQLTSRQAFEAAQEVVFGGNDVVFIGAGVSEEDVLRHFRRFVSRQRLIEDTPHRTFVLLPTRHGKADASDESSGDQHKKKDYWLRANNEVQLRLYMHYGIFAIFYGGESYRAITAYLEYYLRCLDGLAEWLKKSRSSDKTLQEAKKLFEQLADVSRRQGKKRESELLTKEEAGVLKKALDWLLSNRSSLAKPSSERDSQFAITIARALVAELKGRVQARALVLELRYIQEAAARYEADCQLTPEERRVAYYLGYDHIGGERDYLWVRHCPDYHVAAFQSRRFESSGGRDRDYVWVPLQDARKEAARISGFHNRMRPRQRILRVTTWRGGGKGSLASLLLHKRQQETLFPRYSDGEEEPNTYRGAFIAHLSFSMEFTSVLRAMTRFFARRIARIRVERLGDSPIDELPSAPSEGEYQRVDEDTQAELTAIAHVLRDESATPNGRGSKLLTLAEVADPDVPLEHKQTIGCLGEGGKPTPEDLTKLATAVYVAVREEEPRLCTERGGLLPTDLDVTTPPIHRIHLLKDVLQEYAKESLDALPKDGSDAGERTFVLLSGLEYLVDPNGDAYSPAHRSFFRLISGHQGARPSRLPDPPIDLVLMSGEPDTPICYLSEEATPAQRSNLPSGNFHLYARKSATGRWLRKWHMLPMFTSTERVALSPLREELEDFGGLIQLNAQAAEEGRRIVHGQQPSYDGSSPAGRLIQFLTWAQKSDSSGRVNTITAWQGTEALHRLLYHNMALTVWVMTLWVRQGRPANDPVTDPTPCFVSFLNDFNRAATRAGVSGVIEVILEKYREIDRQKGVLNSEEIKQVANTPEDLVDYELTDLVFRHLVLFALPVEPWVLMGCPLLYARIRKLHDIVHRTAFDGDVGTNLDWEDEEKRVYEAWQHWHERVWALRLLRATLQRLIDRSLVIRLVPPSEIQPGVSRTSPEGESAGNGVRWDEQDFLHQRFALHSQLREYFAEKMRFSLLDGGDSNHHQLSIYCDQPSDLPTPSAAHYRMVRDILNEHIKRCRDTLHVLYRHSTAGYKAFPEYWDTDGDDGQPTGRDQRSAANRVFAPDTERLRACISQLREANDPKAEVFSRLIAGAPGQPDLVSLGFYTADGLGGAMGRLHAVPQRLRGALSVLKGSFSIGALSRLDNVESESSGDRPFETYRGWLRSLTNAAIGLERNRGTVGGLLKEAYLRERADIEEAHLKAGSSAEVAQQEVAELNIPETTHLGDKEMLDTLRERADAVRKAACADIKFNERQTTRYRHFRHPFYRDEIAWLYNERGLTALVQGDIRDALSLFDQAQAIVAHQRRSEDDDLADFAAERRIQLNKAIALIWGGRIDDARRLLTDLRNASESVDGSTPSQNIEFARLYLALCDHLGGGFERARKGYEEALERFIDRRQLRAVAIAHRHYADLLYTEGRLEDALKRIELSVNAAAQAEQRDEQHLALVSRARIFIALKRYEDAQGALERVRTYAEQMGLFRLQVDLALAETRLMLSRGENGLAAEVASRGVAIALRYGMGLRRIGGLVLFAQSRLNAGDVDLAVSILKQSKEEAESLGYQTQAAKAGDLLAECAKAK